MKNKRLQNEIGITLIALVITVIVLLILAGVVIATLTGPNGILENATKAKEESNQNTLLEEVKIALSDKLIDDYTSNGKTTEEALNEVAGATVTKNESVGDMYYVERDDVVVTVYEDGTVLEGRVDVWDGISSEVPEIDEEFNWHIYNTAQMNFFARYCNGEVDDAEKQSVGITEEKEITEETTVYLENNLDMGARQEEGVLTLGTEWKTIWTCSGTFEGNNNTIFGIYINNTTEAGIYGLFGMSGNTIQNLTIQNSYIEGCTIAGNIFSAVGAIVGINVGEVKNCNNVNTIVKSENGNVGGIVGVSDASVENCTNSGEVISKNGMLVGGIIGTTYTGINGYNVTNCVNTGNVSGSDNVGGIVGQLYPNTNISNCSNTGNITSTKTDTDANNVGGIAGVIFGDITNSHNTGKIQAEIQAGGIAGSIGTDCEANITNCYNEGEVQTVQGISGGIVGWTSQTGTSGRIENNYNKGKISGENQVGGIIGRNALQV